MSTNNNSTEAMSKSCVWLMQREDHAETLSVRNAAKAESDFREHAQAQTSFLGSRPCPVKLS